MSRIELRRTSSASQVYSRCDLWRISPWSGPPVRCSNASSRPRSSMAAVSDMIRIGKTQPSSRYCSIWAGVRHFGIDPRARANRITTTPRTERPRSILPRLREARGRKSGGERVWTNPTTIGPEIWALRLSSRRCARASKLRMLDIMESAKKISGLNAAISGVVTPAEGNRRQEEVFERRYSASTRGPDEPIVGKYWQELGTGAIFVTITTKDFYRSSNGDRWQLIRDIDSGRSIVRHEPNLSSGGRTTDTDVEEFLNRTGSSPENLALRALLDAQSRMGGS